jgi:UPF0755 protein
MTGRRRIKTIILILVAAGLLAAFPFLRYYRWIFTSNTDLQGKKEYHLYIPTGSEYNDVLDLLDEDGIIRNRQSFEWLAARKNYPNHVYPGHYRLQPGMSNNRLISMLRAGSQEPVMLTFNNIRTIEQLATIVSRQIEANREDIIRLLNDRDFLDKLGLTPATRIGIFLPDSYEFYWNTSAEQFINRMYREYSKFWNRERLKKAEAAGLSPMEVMTLASIVDEEAIISEEEPAIAGVYMNRLRKGIRLQADPTIKFANGDMNIQRVLKKHLVIDSPYNTYRYGGLPPGPIRIASLSAIMAVLDYQRHDYLYFCAKDDFSGYHVFARTLDQHNANARAYRKALDKKKIYN